MANSYQSKNCTFIGHGFLYLFIMDRILLKGALMPEDIKDLEKFIKFQKIKPKLIILLAIVATGFLYIDKYFYRNEEITIYSILVILTSIILLIFVLWSEWYSRKARGHQYYYEHLKKKKHDDKRML